MNLVGSRSYRVVVLVSGRGSNMKAVLQKSREPASAFSIVGIVSDQANAAALSYGAAEGIHCTLVPRLPKERSAAEFNSALAEAVQAYSPDLVVLAGFMRIIGPEFISRFPDRIINIHPALLPSFRGLHAQAQALAAGVRFAGCTVHFVIEEVDAGAIIAQAVVPVSPKDTEESLSERILRQEHALLPKVVQAFACGEIKLEREEGKCKVTVTTEQERGDDSCCLISL